MQFLEDHDQVVRDLMVERDANKDLYRINVDLANENNLLNERLKASEDRVLFLQGFTRTVITRFDVIKEAINALEHEARDHGIKFVKAQRIETEEEKAEAEAAAQLIASLPTIEGDVTVTAIPAVRF